MRKWEKWEMIKSQCINQSLHFMRWDAKKSYETFHSSHYDWWAFPVDKPSSYRDKYQIGHIERTHLLEDPQFIDALRTNSVLVCRAWGYDLIKGDAIAQNLRTKDQKWHRWPIRLFKMTTSLQLFQQWDLHRNAIRYGLNLIHKGQRFTYSGKDLQTYYLNWQKPMTEKKEEKRKPQRKRDEKCIQIAEGMKVLKKPIKIEGEVKLVNQQILEEEESQGGQNTLNPKPEIQKKDVNPTIVKINPQAGKINSIKVCKKQETRKVQSRKNGNFQYLGSHPKR